MHAKKVATLVMLAMLVALGACPRSSLAGQPSGPEEAAQQGAWLDSVVFTRASGTEAVPRLQAAELDLYASGLGSPTLFQAVLEDPELTLSEFYGSYNELTLNPYGPTFNDGRLNPLSSSAIREALNWLIDREHIAQTILGGKGIARWTLLGFFSADHARYQSAVAALEAAYAYDLGRAQAAINAAMLAMGAVLHNGVWHYNAEPITLILLIRTEDARRRMGDYVADQLQKVGFRVDRQYKTSAEASALWVRSDPAEGLWHIYTAGWITTAVDRDSSEDLAFFYLPYDYPIPLHQAYTPSPEFEEVALRLRDGSYTTMAEREQLFTRGLELAMNDSGTGSVRVWLVDQTGFAARRSNVTVANDLAAGANAEMWPYVARFAGEEGGALRIGQAGLLVDPWNPIAGSNWAYDQMPIRGTQDVALITDPHTGLRWPQRAASAQVVVTAGLPVTKTLDWVTLSFEDEIAVPADAWVDWDAAQQRFVTAGEKYPGGLTANTKSTIVYPSDLFTSVTWHDGSPLDLSDFVMRMIMQFDPAKPGSPIYDESRVQALETFLAHFRGVQIESTEPLIITTYDDGFFLDAEQSVVSWWPNYDHGPGPWHTVAVGIHAEAAGGLAFSASKASALGVEWANYLAGPSLDILETHMHTAATEGYIPYAAALAPYVTAPEAAARWANLQAWYAAKGHFWVGSGPFYVGDVQWNVPALTLAHFAAFPDAAGRWDAFAEPAQPEMVVNYATGAPGSYLNILGTGFPADSTASIAVNNVLLADLPVDSSGVLSFTLTTDEADAGVYHVQVRVNPVAGVQFTLDPTAALRPREGDLPLVVVPEGLIRHFIYLPVVLHNG